MWLSAVFEWIWRSSIFASIIIIFILLFKTIVKGELGVRWHYYIWFLVLIRLLLPTAPESPASIFNLFSHVEQIEIPTTIIFNARNQPASINNPLETQDSLTNIGPIEQGALPEGEGSGTEGFPVSSSPSVDYLNILLWIWMLGVFLLASYTLKVNLGFWHKIKDGKKVSSESITNLLEKCKKKTGVTKPISMIETKCVTSPTLFGFFTPTILLPDNISEELTLDELRYIFLHELSHIKQKDILTNWVIGILQILHWFNPVIWYGFYRMKQDREVACDALALSFLNEGEYKNYGSVIINLLERVNKPLSRAAMISIIDDKANMKKRISMIAVFRNNSTKISMLAISILVLFGIVFLTDAYQGSETANRGNTVGNISNYGLAAEYEGMVYYSNLRDEGRLYKKGLENGIPQLVTDDHVGFINVFDDWVYYRNDDGIYKIRTDGSERTQLSNDDVMFINVVDDWIYYINYAGIYKIKIDGSERTLLKEVDYVTCLNVVDGWIYYVSQGINKMKIDGSKHTRLTEKSESNLAEDEEQVYLVYSMNVVDNQVYYASHNGIFKMDTDGRNIMKLSEDYSTIINVSKGWLFYVDMSEGWWNIYRIKTDGTNKARINDVRSSNIYIIGNKVYYYNANNMNFEYVYKDAHPITADRAREEINSMEVKEKLYKAAVDTLGKAPEYISELAWADITMSGIDQVHYDEYIPYASIYYRMVPESNLTDEKIRQAEEKVIKLLKNLATTIPDIDYLIDSLILEIMLPVEITEDHGEIVPENVGEWRFWLAYDFSCDTLTNMNWDNVSVGELQELANYFRISDEEDTVDINSQVDLGELQKAML